ncbi:hypothetical protein AUJ84_01035 [Candidatus Pacearchaeota archaeon CG1_02_32_132]|nr:MAG: hypothetical protein AUJ84_01035 [Candidatus Pacearchaeota archaeon CG1_02_32_132]
MLLEIILALILGTIAGTFTGITPGIHINLIALILVSLIPSFPNVQAIALVIFVVSMATTHTFIDFIPSIFLGAPEEDTFLSVLPGHQMLKQGKAYEAIILTLYGSASALIIILLFIPIFIYIVPAFFSAIQTIFPYLLIFISVYLIFREDNFILALTIFLMTGFLGLASFNLPIEQPLFPLLTGLFGSSALIISIKQKTSIPYQEITPIREIKITKKEYFKSLLGSIISAPLCSFLPGVGSGHAAIIGSEFIEQSQKGFLVLLGAINTIVTGLSFITLFSLGKTRTGAALAVKEIIGTISIQNLIILTCAIIISGILSFFIAIKISKTFSKYIGKINYQYLSIAILVILSAMILLLSNFLGFLTFVVATSLGIYTILSGARRINLMGVLLIPTIISYLV